MPVAVSCRLTYFANCDASSKRTERSLETASEAHRDAIEEVGAGHRLAIVGYHDELGMF